MEVCRGQKQMKQMKQMRLTRTMFAQRRVLATAVVMLACVLSSLLVVQVGATQHEVHRVDRNQRDGRLWFHLDRLVAGEESSDEESSDEESSSQENKSTETSEETSEEDDKHVDKERTKRLPGGSSTTVIANRNLISQEEDPEGQPLPLHLVATEAKLRAQETRAKRAASRAQLHKLEKSRREAAKSRVRTSHRPVKHHKKKHSGVEEEVKQALSAARKVNQRTNEQYKKRMAKKTADEKKKLARKGKPHSKNKKTRHSKNKNKKTRHSKNKKH